jgi:hypothetical protein
MRLIQFKDGERRAVARIDGGAAVEIAGTASMVELAGRAIKAGRSLAEHVEKAVEGRRFDYKQLLADNAVLPPIDHPDPAHCYVTGTGLTHMGGAAARDAMHKKAAAKAESETDSIKMFRLGVEGGKPKGDGPGVQPEWFYKGDGSCLVPPGGELELPDYALDGGEEPEIAGVYLIAPDGTPVRLGFALGNEFSDHVMERQNYLYLAHSKLRNCAIGPELRVGGLPAQLEGESRIIRDGKKIWGKPFVTGETNMSHAIANLEFHHFKYPQFRRPGDAHIHFFGTATLSIADNIKTEPGDMFEIELTAFGAPLRNRIKVAPSGFSYRGVKKL